MNAWQTVVRLADEDLIEDDHLEAVERCVRLARRALIGNAHEVVAAALLAQLEDGVLIDAAIAHVEDMVMIHHRRSLLASAGRRSQGDGTTTFGTRRPTYTGHPVHAA